MAGMLGDQAWCVRKTLKVGMSGKPSRLVCQENPPAKCEVCLQPGGEMTAKETPKMEFHKSCDGRLGGFSDLTGELQGTSFFLKY